MTAYAIVTLGAFAFDGSGATINGDILIGPLPRTIGVVCNALSAYPQQTTDFVSGYRQIQLPAKLAGRDTIGETAANHLQRMLANLRTEVEKDANTLVIQPWGMDDSYSYTVYKNEGFPVSFTPLSQSRSVLEFSLTLSCLP